jgi:hypothetical protein
MTQTISKLLLAPLTVLVAAGIALTPAAEAAGKRDGGGSARASSPGGARGGGAKQQARVNNTKKDVRTTNVRNTSVNNVNVNRNVNVDVDRRGGCCGWDNDYHPVATAAAVTATVAVTSAVIGSIVNAPPPGCVPINYGGIVYQQCGTTWYMPQGVQFVVVNPPY